MNDCKLISVTPDVEKHIAYCARVTIHLIRTVRSFLV